MQCVFSSVWDISIASQVTNGLSLMVKPLKLWVAMAYLSEEETPCILIPLKESVFVIIIKQTKLTCTVPMQVGSHVISHNIERSFPEIDDMFALPMRGLVKLAREWFGELKSNNLLGELR